MTEDGDSVGEPQVQPPDEEGIPQTPRRFGWALATVSTCAALYTFAGGDLLPGAFWAVLTVVAVAGSWWESRHPRRRPPRRAGDVPGYLAMCVFGLIWIVGGVLSVIAGRFADAIFAISFGVLMIIAYVPKWVRQRARRRDQLRQVNDPATDR